VIDVGAGVGALSFDLRAVCPDAWLPGIDRSPGMLRLAPVDLVRVVADARALPIRASSADLVLCLFMLFHLDDPCAGICEARRVLRPGGMIGTITWETTSHRRQRACGRTVSTSMARRRRIRSRRLGTSARYAREDGGPPSCSSSAPHTASATDDVRARLVELIRHLEAEGLIPPNNWDVSARAHR
jgi:ubiquinone/menaquinone biosynthesis C-methylase UbiE